MLNRVIKFSFAVIGMITGITLVQVFLEHLMSDTIPEFKAVIYIGASIALAVIFYSTGNKLMGMVAELLEKLEGFLQGMTLYEIMVCSIGLIIGLIIANLVTIPINRIDIIGMPISVCINIIFGCMGIAVAAGKKNENFLELFKKGANGKASGSEPGLKLLDTSVIIDGRIVDICRSGFIEGDLIVPSFVLEELRHIADSADGLKRNRGRRGLDVLNMLQKELQLPVRIENVEIPQDSEVDTELLKLAKKLGGKVMTIDYNLNKIASFQGVPVLNINDLANGVKPIALPGEDMIVQVIKDGKENGQGIGYLDDGTMIVIEGGRRHIGESVNVTVTSTLQTAAGRMIFAKPKYSIERVI